VPSHRALQELHRLLMQAGPQESHKGHDASAEVKLSCEGSCVEAYRWPAERRDALRPPLLPDPLTKGESKLHN
jgi:hypothetical protein